MSEVACSSVLVGGVSLADGLLFSESILLQDLRVSYCIASINPSKVRVKFPRLWVHLMGKFGLSCFQQTFQTSSASIFARLILVTSFIGSFSQFPEEPRALGMCLSFGKISTVKHPTASKPFRSHVSIGAKMISA